MKLAVISNLASEYKKLIQQDVVKFNLKTYFSNKIDQRSIEFLRETDILLADPYLVAPYLKEATNLKWMQSTWAGVDSITMQEENYNFLLTGVKNCFGDIIAEYVIGYLIAIYREFFKYKENQDNKKWEFIPYTTLKGKSLCIAGAGSIGSTIAKVARSFGMKTFGYTKSGKPVEHVMRVFNKDNLDTFLSIADILVVSLPLTRETENMINETWFNLLPENCIFINVGRGKIVDERALINSLRQGKIRAAVLDVFQDEPLSKESPLWDMENVIITPHVSGFSFPEHIVRVWSENLKRFFKGQELIYKIDFRRGY